MAFLTSKIDKIANLRHRLFETNKGGLVMNFTNLIYTFFISLVGAYNVISNENILLTFHHLPDNHVGYTVSLPQTNKYFDSKHCKAYGNLEKSDFFSKFEVVSDSNNIVMIKAGTQLEIIEKEKVDYTYTLCLEYADVDSAPPYCLKKDTTELKTQVIKSQVFNNADYLFDLECSYPIK